jgi:hypothetical protein
MKQLKAFNLTIAIHMKIILNRSIRTLDQTKEPFVQDANKRKGFGKICKQSYH